MPSIDENLAKWSKYNWKNQGDEWSACWGGTDALWHGTILPRIHYMLPSAHILELAPGFGRCTQYLAAQCNHLSIVDLAETCIGHCKKRFAELNHISFYTNDGFSLDMIADNSIDFVFSWDSFVHVESDVIQAYLSQLSHKLKPGGCGFIHHSNMGAFLDPKTGTLSIEKKHWRATSMSGLLFQKYCTEVGLTCLSQELIGWGGSNLIDCFSFFQLEKTPSLHETVVIRNAEFMTEASRGQQLSALYASAKQNNPTTAPIAVHEETPVVTSETEESPKILFVCHDFPPYRFAGAQMYALNLAQAINQSGKGHVEIFYPVFRDLNKTNYSIESKDYNSVTVHELSKPKVGEMEKVYDEKAARSFELFLDQHHYDIVHFHGLGQLSFALPLVAHSKNISTALTLHDYWFICDRWHMIRRDQSICSGPQSLNKCTQCHIVDNDLPASKDMEELVLRYHRTRKNIALKTFQTFDLIQAPSNYLQKTFEQFGFPGVHVFPLGLATQPSISLDNRQTKLLTFGYMGQLILRKGINFLLDAFKETPGDIRLLIWGDHDTPQPYQMRIRELAKRDPRVRLMGKYEPTQLPSIFNQIDVAVIPSLMENYPITALEALHYKTPVIASRTGGIPEIVIHRENGLLFEAGSVSELKTALSEIINNPALITTLREQIKPVRTIEDDASETINAYRALNLNQSNPSNDAYSRKRPLTVQFYVYKNVHWPMFESLFEYLRGQNDVREIVICLPSLTNLTNSGTNHHLVEKLLTLGARIVTDPRKANADVTFIADTIAGKVHGCGRIVNVGHGTISKGYYFTDNVWTERENWVDLLCVPGEYARERMSAILKTKVVATGMPKLDPVFSGHHTKSALCSVLGLNPSKKIVLYAPTFNLNLSSVFAFADSFHQLDSPDRYVLIKLHGSTLPHLIEQYRRIAKDSQQIIFIEDNNIAPYIGGADIMVSDVSSAFMEFMALNKPVILYDNPGWDMYHGYDPENIEYAWRDLGTRISSFEELPTVLDRLMSHSDGKEPIRQKYAAQLFADRSGQACENVWKETLHLAQAPVANPLPVFSVVIHVEQDAHILLRSLTHDLQFNSVMPVELILVATEGALPEGFINPLVQFNEFVHVKLIDAPQNMTVEKAVALGVNASTGDFICVLREDVALFKNFDYMLYKTFAAHPEIALLTGLTNLPLPGINSNQYLANERSEAPDGLAYRFINQFRGIEIAPLYDQPSIPPLVVYRKKSIDLSAGDLFPTLRSLIAQGKAAICLSLFYHSLDSAFRASLLKIWRMRSSLKAQDRLKIMSDVVSHLSCSDMSEVMVRDAMKLALPKSQYRQGIANSLHTRYYDTQHKAWLSSILDTNDPWAKSLQSDCRIIDALKAAIKSPGLIEQEQNNNRVMFYFFKNVHIPILLPLYHALKSQADVEIGFSFLPPSPQIRAGLLPNEVRIIEQAGVPIHATPQEFRPDLTFIADSVYPWVEGCGKLVHVGHGVLSKGQYYTDTPTARREDLADLVCVPGKHHQAIMRRIISKPVVATGMCKLDDLFSGRVNRASVLKQYGLPADYRYVLFAPTFNDELSAIPFVQDRIGEILPDDKTLLIIKLHPSSKPEYKEMYRALPNKDKRVIFADELDITPFLALCDVMISDVSSAMMEFAALDKPVILFNNPNWTSYQNFNPADIEFEWRDIGIQVADLDEMRAAVSLCLQDPGLHADKRKKYTDLLFANKRGGNAAERIVKLALSLLEAEQDR
ncbi:MAG: CDP-glycerol glycerophosphotransferase family protein [Desulfomicrobium sp.]|nr:CDP-glycerol glycerophosphotransferase family protein [Pseudomonadota bacterium]MBU4594997.1 CDP-glycerol glycerophosphotransferase family protein [Pseudomonadota bacterium]MBV1711227.1 CDP-glycerol glycerophosphotransferase family protein [Desulfomicrobium sp.]MBV1746881.1 CDP-glycerol glycerophosphotransferase family protein [Desulfomicrobium sp.]